MIISITGHRPDKLPDAETGWTIPNPTYIRVCKKIKETFEKEKPEKVICGMSLGTDTYAAFVCTKMGIPFVAAVPFVGQERLWNETDKKRYTKLLSQASEVKVISEGGYEAKKMQIRNEWMVMNSDKVLAVWDGSAGGTGNCVRFAKLVGKPLIIINPNVD